MAAGDLSMPVFGAACSCVAISTYRARRWFIGASLGCVDTVGRSASWKDYFLRYRQVSTGYKTFSGAPIPDGDFTIDWSTKHASYGTGFVTGTLPIPSGQIRQPPRQVIGGSLKGQGSPTYPNLITSLGAYVFQSAIPYVSQQFGDQLPYNLISFTPGNELTVEVRTTVQNDPFNAALGNGQLVQYFTQHLDTTRMMTVLEADYADPVNRAMTTAVVSRPFAGPWEDYGAPPFKGGVEFFDLSASTRVITQDGMGGFLLNFQVDLGWPPFVSSFRFVNPETESLDGTPGFNFFYAPLSGKLHWIVIRIPGADTRQLHSYPDGALLATDRFSTDCNGFVKIEPPAQNSRYYAVGHVNA